MPTHPEQRHRLRALSLQRTAAGWGLYDEHDRAVFAARGRDSRDRCLRHASSIGVLSLRFDEQLHVT
jgi:hypothetical protein